MKNNREIERPKYKRNKEKKIKERACGMQERKGKQRKGRVRERLYLFSRFSDDRTIGFRRSKRESPSS